MIWGLSLSEILKRMKCDTSASPLFQFKKSFKRYRSVNKETKRHLGINFELGTIYTNTPLRVGFSWMTPFRGAKFDGVRYAIRGWFGGVCTRVGSTYLWEWAPRGPWPLMCPQNRIKRKQLRQLSMHVIDAYYCWRAHSLTNTAMAFKAYSNHDTNLDLDLEITVAFSSNFEHSKLFWHTLSMLREDSTQLPGSAALICSANKLMTN